MLGWGAFIDVGNGHRGLLHVDEMKWPEGAMAPSAYDCVKEEQSVEVPPSACLSNQGCACLNFQEGREADRLLAEPTGVTCSLGMRRTSRGRFLCRCYFASLPQCQQNACGQLQDCLERRPACRSLLLPVLLARITHNTASCLILHVQPGLVLFRFFTNWTVSFCLPSVMNTC